MEEKRVLIIENDPVFESDLRQRLQSQNLAVISTPDGHQGFERAMESPPACIVLAAELPGMSGYSLCNRLKRTPKLQAVPILIASCGNTPETFLQHQSHPTHADCYILKQSLKEIAERVIALAGEIPGSNAAHSAAEAQAKDCIPSIEDPDGVAESDDLDGIFHALTDSTPRSQDAVPSIIVSEDAFRSEPDVQPIEIDELDVIVDEGADFAEIDEPVQTVTQGTPQDADGGRQRDGSSPGGLRPPPPPPIRSTAEGDDEFGFDNKLNFLRKTLKKRERELDLAREEMFKARARFEESDTHLKALNERYRNQEEQLEKVQQRKIAFERELRRTKEEMEATVSHLDEENRKLEAERGELTKWTEDQQSQINVMQQTLHLLNQQKDQESLRFREEIDHLRQTLEGEQQALTQTREEKQRREAQLSEDIDVEKNRADLLQDSLEALGAERDSYVKQVEELTRALEGARTQQTLTKTKGQEALQAAQREMESALQAKQNEGEQRLQEWESARAELKSQMEAAEAGAEARETELTASLEERHVQTSDLEATLEKTRAEMGVAIEQLEGVSGDLSAKLDQTEQALLQSQNEQAQLGARIHALEQQLDVEVGTHERDVTRLSEELRERDQAIFRLEQILREKKEELGVLEIERATVDARLKKTQVDWDADHQELVAERDQQSRAREAVQKQLVEYKTLSQQELSRVQGEREHEHELFEEMKAAAEQAAAEQAAVEQELSTKLDKIVRTSEKLKGQLNDLSSSSQEEVTAFQRRVEEQRQRIEALEFSMEQETKEAEKTRSRFSADLDNGQQEIARLSALLDKERKENRETFLDQSDRQEKAKTKIAFLEERLESTVLRSSKLERAQNDKLKQAEATIDELAQRQKDLSEENQRLSRELRQESERATSMGQQLERASNELTAASSREQGLNEEIGRRELAQMEELSSVQQTLQQERAQMLRLKKAYLQKKGSIAEMEGEMEFLRTQHEETKRAMDAAQKTLYAKEHQVEALEVTQVKMRVNQDEQASSITLLEQEQELRLTKIQKQHQKALIDLELSRKKEVDALRASLKDAQDKALTDRASATDSVKVQYEVKITHLQEALGQAKSLLAESEKTLAKSREEEQRLRERERKVVDALQKARDMLKSLKGKPA